MFEPDLKVINHRKFRSRTLASLRYLVLCRIVKNRQCIHYSMKKYYFYVKAKFYNDSTYLS